MKKFIYLLLAALAFPSYLSIAQSPASPPIEIRKDVLLHLTDGTILHADVYEPAGGGKYPVLLQRTPYDKSHGADFGRRAAAAGYVVVIQDVRGRFTSQGDWYPFKYESQDGYETVEWAAALPDSNGQVGMFGGSYVGATQLLAAIDHPPHLAGIMPVVTASNYHDGWTYQSGAFEQWFNESWTSGLALDTMSRLLVNATNARVGGATLPLENYPVFNADLPSGKNLTSQVAPYFLDWLSHPSYDDYWKQWTIADHYNAITVPALTVAAWYDIFQGGSLRNYLGLRDHAANQEARQGQHLLITIGGHAGIGRHIGDVDFGPAAEEFNEDNLTLDWYNYLFKGVKNQFATGKPVRIFVMGNNAWRDESEWPLKRATSTKFYLHSSGKAAGPAEAGQLSTTLPGHESADEYTYDPLHPVPTLGGPLCCDAKHLQGGPVDQRSDETRPDVLTYTTPPMQADTEVTGPVSVQLYANTSVVDTDFTAKLVDVWPNGFAQNLTEGIVRARYATSQETPHMLTPSKIYPFTIDLWSTSNVFLKGHQIRLEISSSNFPRFDRNLNTGKDPKSDNIPLTAHTRILHDVQHPSFLELPIVSQ